jgi:hypothetical protein
MADLDTPYSGEQKIGLRSSTSSRGDDTISSRTLMFDIRLSISDFIKNKKGLNIIEPRYSLILNCLQFVTYEVRAGLIFYLSGF